MVSVNRIMKYMTRMGQNTGMLRASKHVQIVATKIALVDEYLQIKGKINQNMSLVSGVGL